LILAGRYEGGNIMESDLSSPMRLDVASNYQDVGEEQMPVIWGLRNKIIGQKQ
jgi:hypothetical protein